MTRRNFLRVMLLAGTAGIASRKLIAPDSRVPVAWASLHYEDKTEVSEGWYTRVPIFDITDVEFPRVTKTSGRPIYYLGFTTSKVNTLLIPLTFGRVVSAGDVLHAAMYAPRWNEI